MALKAPPVPRRLYGLNRMAAWPDAPVLLAEGEKTADAAAVQFPSYVAMTWQGGAKATGKADWTPLAGRAVTIWPDADDAGRNAAVDTTGMAGQQVRVVDVPADAGTGLGLFESLHGEPDGGAFAKRMTTAAWRLYGTAGRAFLEKLAVDADALAAAANEVRRRFLAQHVPKGTAGQVARVGDRFALMTAAGEMAVALGVLPFEPSQAERAAARCFGDWRGTRDGGNGATEDAAALSTVRHFIGAHDARFEPVGDDVPDDVAIFGAPVPRPALNRAGWKKRTEARTYYCILPETWRREVAAVPTPSWWTARNSNPASLWTRTFGTCSPTRSSVSSAKWWSAPATPAPARPWMTLPCCAR